MKIEEELFRKCKLCEEELLNYGFIKENDYYKYNEIILDNAFKVEILVNKEKVTGKVYDLEFMEEYTSYRVEKDLGKFASKVKEKFIDILTDIKEKCFVEEYFVYKQTNRLTNLIGEKYHDKPEFLWKNDFNDAVFRNKGKWYGLIMLINQNKLDKKTDKEVEILNVKLDEDLICELLQRTGFYSAYHMNKKTWITIVLDDSVTDEEIMQYISSSYNFTVK